MATYSSVLAWRIPGIVGAWWAAIYGVSKSRTRLKQLSSSSSSMAESANCPVSILPFSAAAAAAAKSLQSCLTLCDPIDGLLPGSSVPGILQARTLEWVANSFSNA